MPISLRSVIEGFMKSGIKYNTILDSKLLVKIGKRKLICTENNEEDLYEIKNIIIDSTGSE